MQLPLMVIPASSWLRSGPKGGTPVAIPASATLPEVKLWSLAWKSKWTNARSRPNGRLSDFSVTASNYTIHYHLSDARLWDPYMEGFYLKRKIKRFAE
ncbi:hypothetical protein JCM8547_003439 [Rhodosporidiobolus lusitaniae]